MSNQCSSCALVDKNWNIDKCGTPEYPCSIPKSWYVGEFKSALAEVERWVDDLQSGMYINCVYCGHRYGPAESTPYTIADVLKQHIEKCPKHPMSHLKATLAEQDKRIQEILVDNKRLEDEREGFKNGQLQMQDISCRLFKSNNALGKKLKVLEVENEDLRVCRDHWEVSYEDCKQKVKALEAEKEQLEIDIQTEITMKNTYLGANLTLEVENAKLSMDYTICYESGKLEHSRVEELESENKDLREYYAGGEARVYRMGKALRKIIIIAKTEDYPNPDTDIIDIAKAAEGGWKCEGETPFQTLTG